MSLSDRKAVIDFVEQDYFGNVERENIDGVLDCFQHQAEVIVRHGDNPVRYFSVAPRGDHDDLRGFYLHLCGNYTASFSGFKHFVDLDEGRSACYFDVRLTPKPDASYADSDALWLNNCNFFRYENGKIKHMIIYYSNPDSAASHDVPTGYPRK